MAKKIVITKVTIKKGITYPSNKPIYLIEGGFSDMKETYTSDPLRAKQLAAERRKLVAKRKKYSKYNPSIF